MLNHNELLKFIDKLEKKEFNCSKQWRENINNCRDYIINNYNNLYNYKNDKIIPEIFTWPEDSIQNKYQYNYLKKNLPHDNIFLNDLNKNTYGPNNIKLYNNVQLDRVQHIWSIYFLVNTMNFDLNNENEIIFEFGAGTGQLADVLKNINFKGSHIIYEIPILTVIQDYFLKKNNIETNYIFDNENINIIKGVNFLPCNQNISENKIIKLKNLTLIASYSLTETDIETHNKFFNYIINFKNIYIVYWPKKDPVGDNIDNEKYIKDIFNKMKETHVCNIINNFGNGNIFYAKQI